MQRKSHAQRRKTHTWKWKRKGRRRWRWRRRAGWFLLEVETKGTKAIAKACWLKLPLHFCFVYSSPSLFCPMLLLLCLSSLFLLLCFWCSCCWRWRPGAATEDEVEGVLQEYNGLTFCFSLLFVRPQFFPPYFFFSFVSVLCFFFFSLLCIVSSLLCSLFSLGVSLYSPSSSALFFSSLWIFSSPFVAFFWLL